MHLVGRHLQLYYDARTHERQVHIHVAWLCTRCGHKVQEKKSTAMSLDTRNFGCSDKERCMFPTDLHDFYWQQLSDKSGSWWRNIRSFWGSSLNPCTNLWVGGLNCKGLNTIPRLLYLQMSPSDRFIIWWIPTAGLVHDKVLCKHYETRSGKGCPVNFSSVDGVLITYFTKTLTTRLQVRENTSFISRGGGI